MKRAAAAVVLVASLALVPAASAATLEPTGSLLTERYKAAAAPLPGGDALVVGGLHHVAFGTASESLASAEVYDGATGSFEATGSMAVSRMDPAAAPLPDGRVLVLGGQIWGGAGTPLASAEIYDPETGEFSPTGSMAVPRFGAMTEPLPDGKVLVAGGYGAGTLASAEIYDPETGEFSPTGSMASPRAMGMAAPLPDGRVLIAARGSGEVALDGEIYDPATGTFGLGPEMDRPYSGAGGTLDDGTIVMFTEFSRGEDGALLETREYDPAAEAFSGVGLPALDVERPAVAPLPGGRMLIAGGHSDSPEAFEGQAIVPFAEIYDASGEVAAGGSSASGAAATPAGSPAAGKPATAKPRKPKRQCRRSKAAAKRGHVRLICKKPSRSRGA